MTRNLVLCAIALGGCWFDADYSGGHYSCADGVCPSGLSCVAQQCVMPSDATLADATVDALSIDARIAAATCADPMPLAIGATLSGTTTGRGNTVTSICAASVMNGNDAVYRVDATGQILVSITGTLQAYAIAPCNASPAMPTCIGNTVASAGNPISIAVTGTTFIVIDDANPATAGAYAVSVTQP
jgi:hypothetical protein